MILFLSALPLCHAQRQPAWMNEQPRPGNNTIMYVRESGEGFSLTDATNQAIARVMQNTAFRLGQPFDAQKLSIALENGTSVEVLSSQYNIPIRKIDDYAIRLRDGTYRVWVLCQVASSATVRPQWEELKRAGEVNNWTSLAKSIVVPGLGQIGKGHQTEGWLTLGGELLFVGTGIGSFFIAQEQLDVMRDVATSYDEWKTARSTYNTLQTVSFIAWGAAAVLYAFNLYRAFTMQPRRNDNLALAPMFMPVDNGFVAAISLTIKL